MEREDTAPFRDQWGEARPVEPPRRVARRRQAVWIALATGAGLAVAGSWYVCRRVVIRRLSESCREALRANDTERVEALAQRWRAWEPNKAAPLICLAQAAYENKQYQRTVDLLHELPDDDPMTPPALIQQSTLLFDQFNRPIAGAESLERAVRLNPTLAEARRRLVYFYAFTLQRRKMVEQAYDAIRHDCDFPETYVYLMGRDWLSFANAYDENTKWMRESPDEELFLVARAIYRIKTKALDELETAQTDGPPASDGTPYHRKVMGEYFQRFPRNLELLAYYLEEGIAHGNTAEVARLLAQAPPEANDDNRFWRYRGWLHLAAGELNKAEQCYDRALEINRYDHWTRHQLAMVLRRLKRPEEVRELETLSREGKELRSQISRLESVNKIPQAVLQRMLQYMKKCGDELAASQLEKRLEHFTRIWAGDQAGKSGRSAP
jgi:tetratricopeptide (TPR) repeat protein